MRPGPSNSIWAIRWVIVALGAALGVALIARGNVLIGVLVAVMALARAWMLIVWRRQIARRFPRRFN